MEHGTIDRGHESAVRVMTTTQRGGPLVDIRLWAKPGGGKWTASTLGMAFTPEELPDLIAALEAARDHHGGP